MFGAASAALGARAGSGQASTIFPSTTFSASACSDQAAQATPSASDKRNQRRLIATRVARTAAEGSKFREETLIGDRYRRARRRGPTTRKRIGPFRKAQRTDQPATDVSTTYSFAAAAVAPVSSTNERSPSFSAAVPASS